MVVGHRCWGILTQLIISPLVAIWSVALAEVARATVT